MQEDHVSMGWNAGRKLRASLANLARVLAVELVAAARAIELRTPLAPGPASAAAIAALRAAGVAGPGGDRFLAPELAAAERLVGSGGLIAAVSSATGPLT
jgi:histidine ammonia-lyase